MRALRLSTAITMADNEMIFSRSAEQVELADASFVDDAIFLGCNHSDSSTVDIAGQLLDDIHLVMVSHGFQVNYKRSKTNVMLIPHRRDSELFRLVSQEGELRLQTPHWNLQVHLTESYKYLGTPIDAQAKNSHKIKFAIAKQAQAFGPIR
eukprot:2229597-Pyramimonas_sp.AAC.1